MSNIASQDETPLEFGDDLKFRVWAADELGQECEMKGVTYRIPFPLSTVSSAFNATHTFRVYPFFMSEQCIN